MNADVPDFLRQSEPIELPAVSSVDLAEGKARFQSLHNLASKRGGFVDTDTKLVAIAGELAIIFSLLTNILERRKH